MKKTDEKHKRTLTYEDWMVKKEEDDLNKWRKARDEARKRRAEIEKEQKMKEQLKKTEELEKQKKKEDMKLKEEQLKQLQEDQKALLSNHASVQASETEDSSVKTVMKEEQTSIIEPIDTNHPSETSPESEAKEVFEETPTVEQKQTPESETIVKIESKIQVPGARNPISKESIAGKESLLIEVKEDQIYKTDASENVETVTNPISEKTADTDHKEQDPLKNESENSNEISTKKAKQEIDSKVEPKTEAKVEETVSKPSENNLREKSNAGQFIPNEDQVEEDSPSRNVFYV